MVGRAMTDASGSVGEVLWGVLRGVLWEVLWEVLWRLHFRCVSPDAVFLLARRRPTTLGVSA